MFGDNSRIYRNAIIAFISIIGATLTIFLLIIPWVQYSSRPAFLDILVAPVDTQITINGENYRNAVYELEPGTYTASLAREGFVPETVELNLYKDKTTGLYLYLEPIDNNWGFYTQRKNQESLDALLRLNGYNSDGEIWEPALQLSKDYTSADDFIKKITIKSVLPINFAICDEPASRMTCDAIEIKYDYSRSCNNELCLIITGRSSNLTEKTLFEVKNEISQKGYNFDDYQYTYIQDTEK